MPSRKNISSKKLLEYNNKCNGTFIINGINCKIVEYGPKEAISEDRHARHRWPFDKFPEVERLTKAIHDADFFLHRYYRFCKYLQNKTNPAQAE